MLLLLSLSDMNAQPLQPDAGFVPGASKKAQPVDLVPEANTNAQPLQPDADFVPGVNTVTNIPGATNTTGATPCKTKDGTNVTCGPCEKCSVFGNGCISTCTECEECQAGVCVFSKPGYCYGPGLSKCYRAGNFLHRKGNDLIIEFGNVKIPCTLS